MVTVEELKDAVLLLAGVGGFLMVVGKWVMAERTAARLHTYSSADKVEQILDERAVEQSRRNADLEAFLNRVLEEKEAEIQSLKSEILHERAETVQQRADVADCQRQHAETRIEAAATRTELTSIRQLVENYIDENADLKQQIVFNRTKVNELEQSMERRRVAREEA